MKLAGETWRAVKKRSELGEEPAGPDVPVELDAPQGESHKSLDDSLPTNEDLGLIADFAALGEDADPERDTAEWAQLKSEGVALPPDGADGSAYALGESGHGREGDGLGLGSVLDLFPSGEERGHPTAESQDTEDGLLDLGAAGALKSHGRSAGAETEPGSTAEEESLAEDLDLQEDGDIDLSRLSRLSRHDDG